jgi:hypothetical protein
MTCPNCKKHVDPQTDGKWVDYLVKETVTEKDVFRAIKAWDESAMWTGGQSVLPTELRDMVRLCSL